MKIISYLKSLFKKKEKIENDKILQINHKINSLRNDITLIKLNNNNEKFKKTGGRLIWQTQF